MSGQNSGKRWADLAPLPWAALEQDTGLVLKRELRLEILQRVPLWLGGGRLGEEGGKSMISCFSISDQEAFVVADVQQSLCRHSSTICCFIKRKVAGFS